MNFFAILILGALATSNVQAAPPCPNPADPAKGVRDLRDYADVFSKRVGRNLIHAVTSQASHNYGDPRAKSCRPLRGGQGKATHYDAGFVGRPTSMGYRYNVSEMTAAMPADTIARINVGDLRTSNIDPHDYIVKNHGTNSSQFATTLVVFNPVTNQSRKVVVTDKCGACREHENPVPTGATNSSEALKANRVETQSAIIDLSPLVMRQLTGNGRDTSTFVMLFYCPNIR